MKRTFQQASSIERLSNSVEGHILDRGIYPNSPLILDSSAIIDFEIFLRKSKSKDKSAEPALFYDLLERESRPLFVTRGILEEVQDHHANHTINGYREISLQSYTRIVRAARNFESFSELFPLEEDFRDRVRYDCYWASKAAFPQDHKKNTRDCISFNDLELVGDSICTRSRYLFHAPIEMQPEDISVVILSSDAHVSQTVKVLTNNHPTVEGIWGYQGVYVLDAREVIESAK